MGYTGDPTGQHFSSSSFLAPEIPGDEDSPGVTSTPAVRGSRLSFQWSRSGEQGPPGQGPQREAAPLHWALEDQPQEPHGKTSCDPLRVV